MYKTQYSSEFMQAMVQPGQYQIIPDALVHESTFTGIVHTYSSRLFPIAFRITGNRQEAEDIVQEAFLKLWQRRAEIIPDNLGGWLHKVVTNLAYKHLKRESRKFQLFRSLQADRLGSYGDAEEHLIKKESADLLNKVLTRLPARQRMVYQLSRENGLRRNEIAHHLNLSPNTVKVHLLRALQFMKEHFVSACIFIAFFVLNNLFFQKSNTITRPGDLYKVRHTSNRDVLKKTVHLSLYSCFISFSKYSY